MAMSDPAIEFDTGSRTLPRPSYALYRRMRQLDAHYDRGMRCMNWQKFGDGLANASAGCLATSLAATNPATGISVFTVVTAVEIGIAIVANTSQAHALDEAEAFRRYGLPPPHETQQQQARSLTASGAIDVLSALLLVVGFAVEEWASGESDDEWRPWFVFAVLTAYKLVQSKNSMDEVGLWRCQTRASPVANTQTMLAHHAYFVNAVEMGFTSGIYAATTMGAYVALEAVRKEAAPWFTWVAIGAAAAAGAISGAAKAWFGASPAAAMPVTQRVVEVLEPLPPR